ncbi:hypothetical protein K501DRAFT_243873 [Backusella circina FSU 941]|nr:hypothetical protein K501DRAFT_243873 [Backusella circina FSU 941]
MYFEATYVPPPSPSISTNSVEENIKTPVKETEEPDRPVDHLIFVIHGIGQQTEQYGQFYQHIENLQETTRQVLQAKVPDHNVRIELVPIEWHRHIHEQVDPIISKITLKSIPTIRLIENDYLADVLFYFSKDRGQKIVDNVTELFNTSYHNFMEKHPDFNGKIVIIGYSLGGIITWDILSHQRLSIKEEEEEDYKKLDFTFPKLDFKPHNFFGLGSPIGAVLTFRGQSPVNYRPEDDIQIENVFHPFDPLGYRMEPLFSDYYTDQPAVLVERSIPIGPSFSFPSIPSFPLSTGSFFSFFSWKQQEPAENIYHATEEVAANEENQLDGTGFMSSMTSMMQYFSRGTSKKSDNKQQEEEMWDPLSRAETREQLLSLRDDLNRTLGDVKRPRATRAFTDGLRYNEDESSSTASSISDKGENWTPPKLRSTLSEISPRRQHLVEVLGIDGLRMDQKSRLFDAKKKEEETKNKDDTKNDNDDNNNDNNNLWLDLNNELNKPGPAITSPGESIADVAQDATISGDDDEAIDTSEEDRKREEQEEMKKLPGKTRMDYVLQPESFMSMIANEYLVGLRAHFSYWTNKDLLWHILRRVEIDDKKSESDTQ